MSLEVWLASGRKVTVGGRELLMMPLPIRRLHGLGNWLEESTKQILLEKLKTDEVVKDPFVIVKEVLLKVDLSLLCMTIFDRKDFDGNPLNERLTKDFFDEYLDTPTIQVIVKTFIEVNQVEDLIKNLSSLPVVRKVMEAMSLTFGLPFLNSLRPSTASPQNKSEGSLSRKSTDTSTPEQSDTASSTGKSQTEKPVLLQ